MTHFDDGMIHAWLDGALNDDERVEMERHAATCAECRARVAEARGLLAAASRILSALDDVPAGVTPAAGTAGTTAKRRWLRPTAWAVAAALMLAVGVRTVRESGRWAVGQQAVGPSDRQTDGQSKSGEAAGTAVPTKPAKTAKTQRAPVAAAKIAAAAPDTGRPAAARAQASGYVAFVSPAAPPMAGGDTAAKAAGKLQTREALASAGSNVLNRPAAPAGAAVTGAVPAVAGGSAAMRDEQLVARRLDATGDAMPACYSDGPETIVLDTAHIRPDAPARRVLRDSSGAVGEWERTGADSVVLFWSGQVLRGAVESGRGLVVEGKIWERTACRTVGQ